MNTDELTKEPHERLVEVLLEEEFRGSRAVHAGPTGRGPSRWLAAAVVLLGLAVVTGVMTMRGGGADPTPVQDPKPAPKEPEVVVLKTHAEFLAIADQVQRVRLQVAQSWQDGFVGLPEAVATIDEPEAVRAFVANIPRLLAPQQYYRSSWPTVPNSEHAQVLYPEAQITLELRDGRVVQGTARISDVTTFGLAGLSTFMPHAPFRNRLEALYQQALSNHRIAHGITQSFAELARVPATAKSIRCLPLPPGTVTQHLGRFTQLERLDLEITTTLGGGPQAITIPAPIRLDEYRALPNLRHFHFPGNGLVDADAAALARMKDLTSVRIDGGLGDLSEIGARTLVTNLDAIELVSVKNGNAVVRAAIAAGRLHKVALSGVELTPAEFAALVAMPTLRELDLSGIGWQDSHLAQLLQAKTPLECLRLRSTMITVAGLGKLTAMPAIRELDLRQAGHRPPELDELQQSLPNCRIRRPGEPNDLPTAIDGTPGRTPR